MFIVKTTFTETIDKYTQLSLEYIYLLLYTLCNAYASHAFLNLCTY